MDDRLKQRLVGAAVLVLAAVIFVPMLLDQGAEIPKPSPRMIPSEPLEDREVRVVPLDSNRPAPEPAPALPAEPAKPAPTEEKRSAKALSAPAPAEPAVKSGFAVQLGSFAEVDNAQGLRDGLIARGYRAFMKSSGKVTRVYVGPQSSRAEAQNVLKKLLADTELTGIVVKYSG